MFVDISAHIMIGGLSIHIMVYEIKELKGLMFHLTIQQFTIILKNLKRKLKIEMIEANTGQISATVLTWIKLKNQKK